MQQQGPRLLAGTAEPGTLSSRTSILSVSDQHGWDVYTVCLVKAINVRWLLASAAELSNYFPITVVDKSTGSARIGTKASAGFGAAAELALGWSGDGAMPHEAGACLGVLTLSSGARDGHAERITGSRMVFDG
jgi:hypothetical protein